MRRIQVIGLRYERAGSVIQCSFWADGSSDERAMWMAFLRTLSTIEAPRLIHYGSYESVFLKRMKDRYPTEHTGLLDQLMSTAVNLLAPIYTHVYSLRTPTVSKTSQVTWDSVGLNPHHLV